MKKIALTLAAVAAFGIAGCTPKADTTNNGVDVNATTKDGDTALHLAASQSLDTVIPLLVEHGARLDAKNKRGQTALAITTVAAMRGFYSMDPAQRKATAELLQKLGATE